MKNFITNKTDFKFKFQNFEIALTDNNLNFSENVAKFIDHVKNIQSLMIEKPSDKREYPITKYVAAIFQVKSTDGNAFTLGSRYPLDIYDSESINAYIRYLALKFRVLDADYGARTYEVLYFNFTFSNLENHEIGLRRIEGEYANFETTLDDSKPASLPLNMFYTTWGDTQYTNDGKLEIVNLYFSDNPNEKILVTHLNRDSNLLEIFSDSSKQAQVFLTDKITSHDTKEFVRKIYNRSYHIKDNKVFFIFDLINPQKFITARCNELYTIFFLY